MNNPRTLEELMADIGELEFRDARHLKNTIQDPSYEKLKQELDDCFHDYQKLAWIAVSLGKSLRGRAKVTQLRKHVLNYDLGRPIEDYELAAIVYSERKEKES